MTARIVDLSERSRRNGHATNGPSAERLPSQRVYVAPTRLVHVHEWDVDGVTCLKIDCGAVPNVAHIRETIQIDPLQRGYSYAVAREDWPSLILQGRYRPDETPEQAIRREAILWFINEVLSAGYGVPA